MKKILIAFIILCLPLATFAKGGHGHAKGIHIAKHAAKVTKGTNLIHFSHKSKSR